MARPSVQAVGKAVVATANIVVDMANVLSTTSGALTNLADAGATISAAYAENVKYRAKAEAYGNKETILDEVTMTQAERKAELAEKLSSDEVLASAFAEQRKALEEFMSK